MKTITSIAVALLFCTSLNAQSAKKNEKNSAGSATEKPIENNTSETAKTKQKGNAHGKNKDGKSGREFGQQRSEEARNKAKKDKEISEKNISDAEKELKAQEVKLKEVKQKKSAENNNAVDDGIKAVETKITAIKTKIETENNKIKELNKIIFGN